jgi:hypothetical protein
MLWPLAAAPSQRRLVAPRRRQSRTNPPGRIQLRTPPLHGCRKGDFSVRIDQGAFPRYGPAIDELPDAMFQSPSGLQTGITETSEPAHIYEDRKSYGAWRVQVVIFGCGEHPRQRHRRLLGRIDVGMIVVDGRDCRPLKQNWTIGPFHAQASHPPVVPPVGCERQSYPPLNDLHSTKPCRRPSPSEMPGRCKRLGNGPRNWLGW